MAGTTVDPMQASCGILSHTRSLVSVRVTGKFVTGCCQPCTLPSKDHLSVSKETMPVVSPIRHTPIAMRYELIMELFKIVKMSMLARRRTYQFLL